MQAIFGGGPARSAASTAGAEHRYSQLSDGKIERQGTTVVSIDARAGSGAMVLGGSASSPDFAKQQQQQFQHTQQRHHASASKESSSGADVPAIPAGLHSLALTATYGIVNLASVVMIVVANKKGAWARA